MTIKLLKCDLCDITVPLFTLLVGSSPHGLCESQVRTDDTFAYKVIYPCYQQKKYFPLNLVAMFSH